MSTRKRADSDSPGVKKAKGFYAYLACESASGGKFWSVSVNDKTTTVSYGAIGSKGRTSEKTHPTAAKALAFAKKKMNEKTRKGYHEKKGATDEEQADEAVTVSSLEGLRGIDLQMTAHFRAHGRTPYGNYDEATIKLTITKDSVVIDEHRNFDGEHSQTFGYSATSDAHAKLYDAALEKIWAACEAGQSKVSCSVGDLSQDSDNADTEWTSIEITSKPPVFSFLQKSKVKKPYSNPPVFPTGQPKPPQAEAQALLEAIQQFGGIERVEQTLDFGSAYAKLTATGGTEKKVRNGNFMPLYL